MATIVSSPVPETSFVILKHLNDHNIEELTNYLENLHSNDEANEDHTTLLVNCYSKIRDPKRLLAFVNNFKVNSKLNPETVVKVLRQSNFINEASILANKCKLFNWIFCIQVEDLKDMNAALDSAADHMGKDDEAVMDCLVKYGRTLIKAEPGKTFDLVKQVCVRRLEAGFDPEQIMNIFIKDPDMMLKFLEFMTQLNPDFANKAATNSLLDLYLRCHNLSPSAEEKKKMSEKILKILKRPENEYDANQAMISCKLNNFDPGLLFLYQRQNQFQLILAYHVKNDDAESIMNLCEQFGHEKPNLWVDALCYFAAKDSASHHLVRILKVVEEQKLLSPILVVEMLSKSPLSIVKEFFTRFLTKESEMITENERLIHQLKDETEKMRKSILEMQTKPKVFQAIKCSSCSQTLELPSVHFFCNHSFHHRCFQERDCGSDCPICLPDNESILKLIKSRENNSELAKQFQEQLSRTDSDVIAVVSNYLSKGLFWHSSAFNS